MKILFVWSGNVSLAPFIEEQKKSLERQGCVIDYFFIHGRGFLGYLKNYIRIKDRLKYSEYDVIHAHYGLAGLLACLQRSVPVVITFHGSDVNFYPARIFSCLAANLSSFNIFVNRDMAKKVKTIRNSNVISCGVDIETFYQLDKFEAKRKLGLDVDKKYILFSSSFDNAVKNYPLAKAAVDLLDENVELLEVKGRSRGEVCLLLNACDALLMTSIAEGSPQIVKEALACNAPIVSVDVGDVGDLIAGLPQCALVDGDPRSIADALGRVLLCKDRSFGRDRAQDFDLAEVAQKIVKIYQKVV